MPNILKYSYLLLFLTGARFATAQHTPYKVYDTKAVILQAPYLIDPSDSAITIAWLTDTDCQSKVVYGKKGEGLNQTATRQVNGLVPVDTKHHIRITGLEPGAEYEYKVLSRRVVRLNPYWPDMGKWAESPVYSFTTFNKKKNDIAFSYITDTHENVSDIRTLLKMVDWGKTDFFVQSGDALNWVENEGQLFKSWLTPIASGLHQAIPFIYTRGNHDLRGPFARTLYDYIPNHTGKFYYATDHGPAHFIILDTGEDKPDSTSVYAGLNNLAEYRKEEFAWFKNHLATSQNLKEAPFKIILMHDPQWGWLEDGESAKWTALANSAGVNLILSGHYHRFKRFNPGESGGNKYPILVLDQKQIAHISVSRSFITVEVRDAENKRVDAFQVTRNGEVKDLPNK